MRWCVECVVVRGVVVWWCVVWGLPGLDTALQTPQRPFQLCWLCSAAARPGCRGVACGKQRAVCTCSAGACGGLEPRRAGAGARRAPSAAPGHALAVRRFKYGRHSGRSPRRPGVWRRRQVRVQRAHAAQQPSTAAAGGRPREPAPASRPAQHLPSSPPAPRTRGLLPEQPLPGGEVGALEQRVLQDALHAAQRLRGRAGPAGVQRAGLSGRRREGGSSGVWAGAGWQAGVQPRQAGRQAQGRQAGRQAGSARTWMTSVR